MVRDLVVAGVLAMVAISAPARAEYPDRPVRLIVPFAPGGANDLVGRLLADKLGKVLGRPFIVENRPGAERSSVRRPSQARRPMVTRCC